MLKTIEDVSATRKRLYIEIPPEDIEKEIQEGLDKIRGKARLPGFRQGKAPSALIEKRFGKEVEAEALEKAVSAAYAGAIKETHIRPVSHPVFEKTDDFKRHSPFGITLLVEVMPKLDGIKYEGIKVRKLPASVEESDIEQTLVRLQEEKAVYEPMDEPLKTGDVLVLDYETAVEGLSAKDKVFKLGSETMPPGFSDNLVGMKKDDHKDFDVVFPEDFYIKEVSGQSIKFKVSVKDTKKASLPALDDDFAKDLGFDDLPALKEHIGQRLLKSKQEAVSGLYKAEAVKKILDAHPFDVPNSLVEEEISRLVSDLKMRGRNESEETLRTELVPAAVRHAKASILLREIGEKEGIRVSDDDVRDKIDWLSERMSLTPENVMKYYVARDGSLEGLRHSMFEEKVLDLILQKSVIEEAPPE